MNNPVISTAFARVMSNSFILQADRQNAHLTYYRRKTGDSSPLLRAEWSEHIPVSAVADKFDGPVMIRAVGGDPPPVQTFKSLG